MSIAILLIRSYTEQMKIKRHSFFFTFFILFFIFAFLFAFYMSKENYISLEKIELLNLPTLHIRTNSDKPITSRENYITAEITIDNIHAKGKIRGRGNSTWEARKKPYLLKLDKPISLLNMTESRKWVLLANMTDNTSLRNAYSTYLSKNVWNSFLWTPNYEFVFLFVNGRFDGLYQIYEKIEISSQKLDIAPEGFLVVTNTRDTKPYNFKTEKGISFSLYDPKNVEKQQFEKEKNYINFIETILFSENFSNPTIGWRKYIDEDSLIDWYLLNEFTNNRDARFRDSCYMFYNPKDEKLHMGPIWDFDISMGNNHYPENFKYDVWWIKEEALWYKRLFEDKSFVLQLKSRWNEKYPELTKSVIWLKKYAETMKEFVQLNDNIWQGIGHYQWPGAVDWYKRKTVQDEYDYLFNWIEQRILWMNTEINKL